MGQRMCSLPSGLPCRDVQVPGWAGVFRVPRHVVRIDINEQGKAGTHGWQVRYGPRPWRHYSDSQGSKLRSPSVSLEDATTHLVSIYAGPASRVRATPTKRKANPIQEAGIRLVERQRKNRNIKEIYIEAVSPVRGASARRFYVGTQVTATDCRMQRALLKARQARAEMVAVYHENQRREADTPGER